MIALSDLVCFGQLYPSGSLDDPLYAFAGGTALQCWSHESVSNREHDDIDIVAFNASFPAPILYANSGYSHFFIGGVTQDGIVAYPQTAPTPLQITRSAYFDSEITPTKSDVRSIEIQNTSLLVLSPEFIAVSKMSYPNVHRQCDFQDVLVLNQNGWLQDSQYFYDLLAQTSLSKLISVQNLLKLKTKDDLEALVDLIHRQLIRRFLYWDQMNVDALDRFQFFVLLDVDDGLFQLPSQVMQFIDTMLTETTLNGRRFQIAKLGLHFLVAGIPSQGLSALQNSDFQALIRRGLALVLKQPTFWLLLSKTVFATLRQLTLLEDLAGRQFSVIWNPVTLTKIVQRIFFSDPSRFILLTSVKALYHDLEAGRASALDCAGILPDLLAISGHKQIGRKSK